MSGRPPSRPTAIAALLVVLLAAGLPVSGLPFLQAPQAYAQGGPPMFTEGTGLLNGGQWEVNVATSTEPGTEARLYVTPLVDVNYGLSNRIAVSLTWPYLVRHATSGPSGAAIGRPEIGVKVLAVDRRVRVSTYPILCLRPYPGSSANWVSDRTALLLPVQASTSFGRVTVSSEVAYQLTSGSDDTWAYGATLGRPVMPRLTAIAEIRSTATTSLAPEATLVNAGTVLSMHDHLALLVSGGRYVNDTSPSLSPWLAFAGLQVTW